MIPIRVPSPEELAEAMRRLRDRAELPPPDDVERDESGLPTDPESDEPD